MTPFDRLGRFVVRRARLVIGAWGVLLLLALPFAPQVPGALSAGGFILDDLESARARRYQTLFSAVSLEFPSGPLNELRPRQRRSVLRDLGRQLREGARNVDHIIHAHDGTTHRLVAILPETAGEGAEVFRSRFEDRVQGFLNDRGANMAPGAVSTTAITFPGDEGGYGRAVDGLEGFARTFLLAAFRIAGARGEGVDTLIDDYRRGIVTGVDPDAADRWVRMDEHAQAKVEAASLATSSAERSCSVSLKYTPRTTSTSLGSIRPAAAVMRTMTRRIASWQAARNLAASAAGS